jgi:hypothetical protein
MLKVIITDLRRGTIYRGRMLNHIQQGADLSISLDNLPGYVIKIRRVRGWLVSDSNLLYYLFDKTGRKYRMRVVPEIIDV